MKNMTIKTIVTAWNKAVEVAKKAVTNSDAKTKTECVDSLKAIESLEPKFSSEVIFVAPSELKRNPRNPRESYDYSHIDISCGYIREALIVKTDGTVVRGHLRRECAIANGIKAIPVIVREFNTELDELNVLNDHGTSKPLSKYEVYKSACAFFELGVGESATVRAIAPALEQAFGSAIIDSTNENKNTRDKAVKSKFRGTIQTMFECFQLPSSISDKYTALWRGEVNELKASDIKKLAKELKAKRAKDVVNYDASQDSELVEQSEALVSVNNSVVKEVKVKALTRDEMLKLIPLVSDKAHKALLAVCAGDMSFASFKKSIA